MISCNICTKWWHLAASFVCAAHVCLIGACNLSPTVDLCAHAPTSPYGIGSGVICSFPSYCYFGCTSGFYGNLFRTISNVSYPVSCTPCFYLGLPSKPRSFPGCNTCTANGTTCLSCDTGYYPSFSNTTGVLTRCVTCPKNCTSCTSASNCQSCQSRYALIPSKLARAQIGDLQCILSPIPNCLKLDVASQMCLQCLQDYEPVDGLNNPSPQFLFPGCTSCAIYTAASSPRYQGFFSSQQGYMFISNGLESCYTCTYWLTFLCIIS